MNGRDGLGFDWHNRRCPTPLYDVRCSDGHEEEVLTSVEDCACPCPICGNVTERVWRGKGTAIIPDSCSITQENGFREPRHFTSKIERRRALKEAGLTEVVRHVPAKGSDRSPHTIDHGQIMDPYTLEAARILVSRPGALKGAEDPGPPLHIRYINEVIPRG